jgi:tRNA-guanine transglycosylase
MADFSFEIIKKDKNSRARLGIIKTRNGNIETPYFIPVATLATVRSLDSMDLNRLNSQCTLVNTYHLYLKPGDKTVNNLGGIHEFMNFKKPVFSDSGGFQAFSLGYGMDFKVNKLGSLKGNMTTARLDKHNNKTQDNEIPEASIMNSDSDTIQATPDNQKNFVKITDKGVEFRSIYDGTKHFIGPKESMEIQSHLGTDIIMSFDECTSPKHDYDYTKKSLEETHKWALESLKYHDKNQALYGVVQGGWFEDLRKESATFLNAQPFDGIAIGGSFGDSYGDTKEGLYKVIDWIIPLLDDRPRHLLGIGVIDDIFEGVERGIDTFDCVQPTRIGRRGTLYISPEEGGNMKNKFRINIKSSKYKEDKNPVDKTCTCDTCKHYTRAYLRHLYSVSEIAYYRLASLHNVHFMLNLMEQIRESLRNDAFKELKAKWLK